MLHYLKRVVKSLHDCQKPLGKYFNAPHVVLLDFKKGLKNLTKTNLRSTAELKNSNTGILFYHELIIGDLKIFKSE